MAITHTNRFGKSYFLHGRTDKRGTLRYSFSMRKQPELLVDALPEGHELHEKLVSGQVFLRMVRPIALADDELRQVADAIERHAAGSAFEVTNEDVITVFERSVPSLGSVMPWGHSFNDEGFATYTPVLQLELEDAQVSRLALAFQPRRLVLPVHRRTRRPTRRVPPPRRQ